MEQQPKKISRLTILLIILGIVILGSIFYFVYQKYWAPKPATPAPTTPTKKDSFADWKTYSNEELSFTFKYPPDWKYEETDVTNDENWDKYRSFNLNFDPPEGFDFEINPWTISASPYTHAFDDYTKKPEETVEVDSVDATKTTYETSQYKAIVYTFKHGNDSFKILFNQKITATELFDNFKQLMSTFKFTQEAVTEDTEESSDETADWKTYTNDKYGYSFKYPSDYVADEDCPKPCKGEVQSEEGGDHVMVEGDISEKGWPLIDITHYNTEIYNPTGGKGLYDWLKEKATGETKQYLPESTEEIDTADGKLEVVKVEFPKSPQAYSRWEIYFLKDDKIFKIQMLDIDSQEAKDFYNLWLTTFKK